jgi:hypothetical protein
VTPAAICQPTTDLMKWVKVNSRSLQYPFRTLELRVTTYSYFCLVKMLTVLTSVPLKIQMYCASCSYWGSLNAVWCALVIGNSSTTLGLNRFQFYGSYKITLSRLFRKVYEAGTNTLVKVVLPMCPSYGTGNNFWKLWYTGFGQKNPGYNIQMSFLITTHLLKYLFNNVSYKESWTLTETIQALFLTCHKTIFLNLPRFARICSDHAINT